MLSLDVEFLDSIVRKHIAGGLDCCNGCMICKHLERNWAVKFILFILVKVQLDQILGLKLFASDRVGAVLFDVGDNVNQVKDDSISRANWMLEGL